MFFVITRNAKGRHEIKADETGKSVFLEVRHAQRLAERLARNAKPNPLPRRNGHVPLVSAKVHTFPTLLDCEGYIAEQNLKRKEADATT